MIQLKLKCSVASAASLSCIQQKIITINMTSDALQKSHTFDIKDLFDQKVKIGGKSTQCPINLQFNHIDGNSMDNIQDILSQDILQYNNPQVKSTDQAPVDGAELKTHKDVNHTPIIKSIKDIASITLSQTILGSNRSEMENNSYMHWKNIVDKRTEEIEKLQTDRSTLTTKLENYGLEEDTKSENPYSFDAKTKPEMYDDIALINEQICNHNKEIKEIKKSSCEIKYGDCLFTYYVALPHHNDGMLDVYLIDDQGSTIYKSKQKIEFSWWFENASKKDLIRTAKRKIVVLDNHSVKIPKLKDNIQMDYKNIKNDDSGDDSSDKSSSDEGDDSDKSSSDEGDEGEEDND